MDYEVTLAAKLSLARRLYRRARDAGLKSDPAFLAFVSAASPWLRPYAAFLYLRDLFGSSDHTKWGLLSVPSADLVAKLTSPAAEHADAVQFTFYLQWHLHKQLLAASAHAAAARVVLKGDLPIGVDKCSVDTWMNPRCFRLHTSTGAPPDGFSPTGQNWGFPTYDWGEMAKDGFAWWRARLAQMEQYFGAYRIDHILGFFRIWELPASAVGGLLGRFRPALPVTKHELEAKGLWDIDSLATPYVRFHVLQARLAPARRGSPPRRLPPPALPPAGPAADQAPPPPPPCPPPEQGGRPRAGCRLPLPARGPPGKRAVALPPRVCDGARHRGGGVPAAARRQPAVAGRRAGRHAGGAAGAAAQRGAAARRREPHGCVPHALPHALRRCVRRPGGMAAGGAAGALPGAAAASRAAAAGALPDGGCRLGGGGGATLSVRTVFAAGLLFPPPRQAVAPPRAQDAAGAPG